jgi:predicted Fe-Mo cluster-binding NifX family protein
MIIAVTATGKDKADQLDQRFGRTKYLQFFNTEDESYEIVDNNINLNAQQGAGVQTAQLVVDKGAEVVITGNLGPKAHQVLNVAKIKAYQAGGETVEQVIKKWQAGQLQELKQANVPGHW